MAEIVTGTVTGQVNLDGVYAEMANIRREAAINEGVTSVNVKDAADTVKDQGTAQFIAGQSIAFQTASALAALTAATNAQFTATQNAIQIAQEKNAAAAALAEALLGAQISADGQKTRDLINQQKIDDLRFRELRGGRRNREGHDCHGKFKYGPPLEAVYPTAL